MNTEQALADLGVTPDDFTDQQRQRLDQDGYFIVPGYFSADQVEQLREQFDIWERQATPRTDLAIEPGTSPHGILSASYYFRFYLARALDHAEMADEYLQSLDPWRKLLPLHFSTWPEVPGDTRSDSHAWSAHPIYDMLTLVAGVEPNSHGFATVRIAPHLGNLNSLTASYPHPQGTIQLEYHRQAGAFDATISLPGTLGGSFVFHGRTWPLKAGLNHIVIP